LDGSDSLSAVFTDLFNRWEAALAALVERARASGQLRTSPSSAEAAQILLGALEGGSMLSHVRRRQDDLERMLDAALDCVGAAR
jgi:hypothetical protein